MRFTSKATALKLSFKPRSCDGTPRPLLSLAEAAPSQMKKQRLEWGQPPAAAYGSGEIGSPWTHSPVLPQQWEGNTLFLDEKPICSPWEIFPLSPGPGLNFWAERIQPPSLPRAQGNLEAPCSSLFFPGLRLRSLL